MLTTAETIFYEVAILYQGQEIVFFIQFTKIRYQFATVQKQHRWVLSPVSVISDIGLSLISESPISDWESEVRHYIGYRKKVLSDIRYPTSPLNKERCLVFSFKGRGFESKWCDRNFCKCRISEWTLMSISEHFRYWNDSFQSDIFVSDIRITDVDVGCRISPTLASMSMPTYEKQYIQLSIHYLSQGIVYFL
jgi:hypothetical protein